MKLSMKEKYSFGIGAIGKDAVYAIVSIYLMFYFTDVLGIAAGFVGGLFFVARIWDAINDPIMGLIVDNTRTRWGKFRPWILIGTLVNSVVLIFLFTDCGLTGNALYIYVSVIYILWGMTYTLMDVPYWSMLPNLTSDKEEREEVSVIPRIFAAFATLIVSSLGLKIVSILGDGNQKSGFLYFSIIISAVFIVTILITVKNTREHNFSSSQEKTTLKQMVNVLVKNDQLITFLFMVLLFTVGQQIIAGIQLYYFKYVTGSENLFTVFVSFSGISTILGLIVFPKIVSKLSRIKVYILGCVLPVIGIVMLLLAGLFLPKNPILVGLAGIIYSFGGGFFTGSQTVALADIVDYGECKLGTRNESVIFSIQTLLVKISTAFGGLLTGLILSATGYVPNQVQSATTINGLRIVMTIVPIIFISASALVYIKHYKLNGETLNNIIKLLEDKREKVSDISVAEDVSVCKVETYTNAELDG
ncbi:melibiose:sodium transporter MelB [Clostridium perfringens]|uniref:melibiose:sodium transporter MelB n=1 Tax=Clostridium perfringens TaxID=1502 RepID=UPI001094D17E|nr:melibiose:sodium transporter MelB [Clostridium perfringens]EGT3605870.1 melibiose:sodium transporter MelB [Clostridium perfringens]EGT4138917.1 melibiose:sodium transporter MelB [Clostridium perfringens]TGY47646.1 melibiose:sodium transporter MelB [Clostridium perfringens]HAT4072430.1 melibiose:sodium transporter MelB [Clostridium perfringens]HAT4092494.1 melibiose:sodium transporter MelB [Clostridium perfringens]